MRVTTNMIFDRTIFNLQRNVERFMDTETMMSSGRRINTASDDPIGTHHDLNYRTRLAEIKQYLSSINQGTAQLATYETGLADLVDLYSSAKEITVMMSNDTYDAVTRESTAKEVDSILEQALQLANVRDNDRYLYSGHLTWTKPFEASANGVEYNGDTGSIELEIEKSSRIISNIIGRDLFLKPLEVLGAAGDMLVGLTGATLLSDLNGGTGIDLTTGTFEIFDQNRNVTYTIDTSAATTVDDVINAINTQLGAGSNLSVQIAEAGASLQWNTVSGGTNTITAETPLANLNAGTGVDSGTFLIRNADDSIHIEVDISSAATIGDVITAIDTAVTANGLAGIGIGFNSDGNGLSLTDSNIPPLGLTIEDMSDTQSTAADLGIKGTLGSTLDGADLNPRPDFIIRDIAGSTTAADLGLTGTVQFQTMGGIIRPRVTLDTPLSVLNNNVGFDLGKIKISQGSQTAIIDLGRPGLTTVSDMISAINTSGLEITASLNEAGTGIQIVSTVPNKSLMIENYGDTRTASNLGLVGATDMIGSLMLLSNALRNDDRAVIEQMNGNMDLAIDELLKTQASIGTKTIRMETTRNRLESTRITVTKLLSDVEDADLVQVAGDLAKEENLYQAALLASSKVMQQSLVDFLR